MRFCYDWCTSQWHTSQKEEIITALTNVSEPTRQRILQVCVRLFLEKGYKKTTMIEILRESSASNSSFQNIFHTKDGVLFELVEFMFSNQFSMARAITGNLPPVCVYAVETAIQLTLTELNENLREIYIEAYTQPNIVDYIQRHTAWELEVIFGPYLPGLSSEDFYLLDIGSSGMMRSYMAHPCNEELTLEKKISGFLNLTLRAYNVPREEAEKAIAFVASLDIRKIAEGVMHQLLQALMMKYQFTLGGGAAGQ